METWRKGEKEKRGEKGMGRKVERSEIPTLRERLGREVAQHISPAWNSLRAAPTDVRPD